MTASAEPMVGRDSELSAISELLDALDGDASGVALEAQGVLRSLPDGQREHADLVRLGHTNREIAAMLYVSRDALRQREDRRAPAVARIFATGGVSNRTALASLVALDRDSLRASARATRPT